MKRRSTEGTDAAAQGDHGAEGTGGTESAQRIGAGRWGLASRPLPLFGDQSGYEVLTAEKRASRPAAEKT